MNKVIIGLVVLGLVGGGVWWWMSKESTAMSTDTMAESTKMNPKGVMPKADTMMKDTMKKDAMMDDASMKKEVMPKTGDAMMPKTGVYTAYTPEKLAMATGSRVLFFSAAWCPTCRGVDADIVKNLEAIPASVSIFKVDYDNSDELKKKYGVTYQHTFVLVDANGVALKKWSGSPTLKSVLEMLP